jgi:type II secretory ATPase GspE/PulE/Tfp pilus assembly ATPase PilB-like protein
VILEELNDYLGSELALRLGLGSFLITSVITHNALSAITKLQDMTLDPFLISTSISAVLNQRVVRKICPKCRVKYKPSQALQDKIKSIAKIKEVVFYKGKGCDNCNQTGFVGEIGIFELVIFNEAIRSAIVAGVPQNELKKQIEKNRLRSIWQDGMEKVLRGITTFEEITRVL